MSMRNARCLRHFLHRFSRLAFVTRDIGGDVLRVFKVMKIIRCAYETAKAFFLGEGCVLMTYHRRSLRTFRAAYMNEGKLECKLWRIYQKRISRMSTTSHYRDLLLLLFFKSFSFASKSFFIFIFLDCIM